MNSIIDLANTLNEYGGSCMAECMGNITGNERFEVDILYQKYIQHWMYRGDTALHVVAAGYFENGIQWCINNGIDINSCGNRRMATPLHYAADAVIESELYSDVNQRKMLLALLSHKADIDAVDKNGATAILRAVRCRSFAAVEILVASGANLKIRNSKGSDIIKLATVGSGRGGSGTAIARSNQDKIIQLLRSRI